MIGYLKGKLLQKKPNCILIDVHGVGYELQMPLSNFCVLGSLGDEVIVFVLTYVREDCIKLFGFSSFFERSVFEMLTSVSGVGPKAALNLMGPATGQQLCVALISGDLSFFTKMPGIGQKTAERLLIELKTKSQKILAQARDLSAEKIISTANQGASQLWDDQEDHLSSSSAPRNHESILEDLESALGNMGYNSKHVGSAIKHVQNKFQMQPELTLEQCIREALKNLVGQTSIPTH